MRMEIIELARLHHHVAGVVLLDAGDGDLLGVGGGHLAGGVDDEAIVLAVHPGGEHLHAVGELGEDLVVHRLGAEFRSRGRGGRLNGDGLGVEARHAVLAVVLDLQRVKAARRSFSHHSRPGQNDPYREDCLARK